MSAIDLARALESERGQHNERDEDEVFYQTTGVSRLGRDRSPRRITTQQGEV